MDKIVVAPIVEGHGEVESLRILLTRIWTEMLNRDSLEVLRPIRQKRHKIILAGELEKAVRLASLKILDALGPGDRGIVLLVLDSDEDCPANLAPALKLRMQGNPSHFLASVVLPNPEYETWFAAAPESFVGALLADTVVTSPDPEGRRLGKGWVQDHLISGTRYSEVADQPRFTARLDLELARSRSASFDKLIREVIGFI